MLRDQFLGELIHVYLEIYATEGGEFYSEDRYREQLDSHMSAEGWELVCRLGGHRAGWLRLRVPAAAGCALVARAADTGRCCGHRGNGVAYLRAVRADGAGAVARPGSSPRAA